MNKSYFAIAALLLLVIFTSAQNTNTGGINVGDKAPELVLSGHGSEFSLQKMNTGYVLVTFWTSAVPQSRIDNLQYHKAASLNDHVKHVSVNFDSSEGLMNQLALVDGLDLSSQYHPNAESQVDIMQHWNLNRESMVSYLVDPHGVVVACNPSVDKIARL